MPAITPSHRAIQHYYAELTGYRDQHVTHELALKTAFQTLLQSLAPTAGWLKPGLYRFPVNAYRMGSSPGAGWKPALRGDHQRFMPLGVVAWH